MEPLSMIPVAGSERPEWLETLDQPVSPALAQEYFGNSLQTWLLAAGILLFVAVVLRILKSALVSRLRKIAVRTSTQLDDAWLQVVEATAWFFYFAAGAAVAERVLTVADELENGLRIGLMVLLGVQCAIWAQTLVSAGMQVWMQRQEAEQGGVSGSTHTGTVAAAVRFVSRLLIWSVLVLVVLSNLGIELTTLVAGLGVGGVAAALAVQKVLGDLFAGLSMYFDRPFDIGDFIIVGDVMGNVTKIGLRTTRIDGLGGDKIVYPNGELASRYIRNYQRMAQRRIVFEFGIEYGLPAAKVQLARDIVQETITSLPGVRFDRAHFSKYGASSLDFEVVYYVLSKDYNEYMDRQQEINLAIYKRFEDEGISFAFPTRTLWVKQTEPQVSANATQNGSAPGDGSQRPELGWRDRSASREPATND